MNKELCIKVGKWNNSILWSTVEKHQIPGNVVFGTKKIQRQFLQSEEKENFSSSQDL